MHTNKANRFVVKCLLVYGAFQMFQIYVSSTIISHYEAMAGYFVILNSSQDDPIIIQIKS